MDKYKVAGIENSWVGVEGVLGGNNTVNIFINNDGSIVLNRCYTPEYLIFSPKEWLEIVEFIRETRIEEGWEDAESNS